MYSPGRTLDNTIVNSGIKIVNRIKIPSDMVPEYAQVEITAKVFHDLD